MGETVGFKALHAPAFVVDTNEQVGAQFFDVSAKLGELCAALPIAGKQNEAADQRVFEAAAVVLVKAESRDVDDEGGVEGHGVTSNENSML